MSRHRARLGGTRMTSAGLQKLAFALLLALILYVSITTGGFG